MASDDFKRNITGLVLFVLFSSLLLTFVIGFGANYGRSSAEIGGGSLNLSAFQESASAVNTSAEGFRKSFESGDINNVDNPTGIFTIAKQIISLITTPFRLLAQVMTNVIGIPSIVSNVILGLLAITLILGIWRVLRIGD